MTSTKQNWLRSALQVLSPVLPGRLTGATPIVPVVRLAGIIGYAAPLRAGVTIVGLARSLERAFTMRNASAVALVINSPGGSPVQSHLIFRRIRALAQEYKLPVIAVVEDVGASGGYMIACAADEIVCDAASMVGSIGVVGGSFGFHKLMDNIGIERRIYTAGDRKVLLDPFLPENPDDVRRLKALQKDIHEDFIALVKERRAGRLRGPEEALFSGEFWTGVRALDMGLVDGIGDLRTTLRARFGDRVYYPLINADRPPLLRRLFGATESEAPWTKPSLPEEMISAVEARAFWARFGL